MQFSCASPSHSCPDSGCEVWVCNSDGYVGQVCLLNIKDEPTVEACIAVCSARIICIAAVPGLKAREQGSERTPHSGASSQTQQQQLHISISHSSLELTEPPTGPGAELVPFDSDDTDDEDSPSPSSTLQSQASHSTISSSYGIDEGTSSKDMVTETTSSEEEQEFPTTGSYGTSGMLGTGGGSRAQAESPMDGRAMRRSSRGSFTRASLEDLLSIDPEAYKSSVWLGTEDGCIHVYQSSDNIRNRKNSMKMQHCASILCILYLDNKVFVSLANGEVIVYQREAGSFWDPQSSQTLVLGTANSPVTKMVPVGGKLWCGSQNRILIINTSSLVQEHSFQVGTDSSRCVTCMVAYGHGVWLALQGSAHVRLYHAQTWEALTEVDVAPAVHKMLAGADAIIRQHKAACLRITALLACKDLLWIGTSAGVVLTLVIPKVSSGTGPGTLKSPLVPMGSAHGHTGHVRFLTAIELPEGFDMNFPPLSNDTTVPKVPNASVVDSPLQRRNSARRRASGHLIPKNNHLVISGGDGYEDFRLTNSMIFTTFIHQADHMYIEEYIEDDEEPPLLLYSCPSHGVWLWRGCSSAVSPSKVCAEIQSPAEEVSCQSCPVGTFSDALDSELCRPHLSCEPIGRDVVTFGTGTSDAVCGDCLPGLFSTKESNLSPCEKPMHLRTEGTFAKGPSAGTGGPVNSTLVRSAEEKTAEYAVFALVPIFCVMGLLGILICNILKKKGYNCMAEKEGGDAELASPQKDGNTGPYISDDILNEDTISVLVRLITEKKENAAALEELLLEYESKQMSKASSIKLPTLSPLSTFRSLPRLCPHQSHLHTISGMSGLAPRHGYRCTRCAQRKWPPVLIPPLDMLKDPLKHPQSLILPSLNGSLDQQKSPCWLECVLTPTTHKLVCQILYRTKQMGLKFQVAQIPEHKPVIREPKTSTQEQRNSFFGLTPFSSSSAIRR
ncbi:hypothetical protein WMY93_029440 [Mugilogobius chulae]|uniref:TNFR-Cys domain-containing protein n=1 Tax=Mugilogobius chulae TaxID=88201 RepID=A0AAW0MVK9_9GOBI